MSMIPFALPLCFEIHYIISNTENQDVQNVNQQKVIFSLQTHGFHQKYYNL